MGIRIIILLSLHVLDTSAFSAPDPRSPLFEKSAVTPRRHMSASSVGIADAIPDGISGMNGEVINAAHGDIYQSNNNNGWRNMAIYWSFGLIAGIIFKYMPFQTDPMKDIFSSFSAAKNHLLALICTLGVTPRFIARYDNYSRNPHLGAATSFAFFNGIFETILFLLSYDIGATAIASKLLGFGSKIGSRMLGFFTFFAYSALIHIKFWLPSGLPKHVRADAASFTKQGLPELMLMSISWIWLYVSTGDVISVCILHALFNFIGMNKIALQPPFVGL
mmetsp:Transcript_1267/g.1815  ORF Transcript_1267/g.1815 Transcript_1267/m.1815 type:complete len:277 (-) Transcript_1267:321-1151(-)